MNLKDQVSSIELSKRLKELGVKQKSIFYWVRVGLNVVTCEENWKVEGLIHNLEVMPPNYISAFTVAELGNILPRIILYKGVSGFLQIYKSVDDDWICDYSSYLGKSLFKSSLNESESNARAEMLIYLL